MKTSRLMVMIFLLCMSASVQAQKTAQMKLRLVDNFFKLPEGYVFGEGCAMAANSKGHIFVFHRGDRMLMEFDPDGNFIREFIKGKETFQAPHALRIDKDDNIWTTDLRNHIVIKFSPEGEVLMVLGRKQQAGEFIGKWNYTVFNEPTDVAFSSNGDIFVTDGYKNARVVKFDKDGKFIKTWGERGNEKSQFRVVHTIDIDENDILYVGDRENGRIQIFDTEGNFIDMWSHTGDPYSIHIAGGYLYTIDGVNDKVKRFDMKGNLLAEYGERGFKPGQLNLPHWVHVNGNEMYIAEVLSWRFQKFIIEDL
jgi:DNA-binding beta-propeller fold protein YncE